MGELESYKKRTRTIAAQLKYDHELISKIMAATSETEVDRLMRTGRSRIPDHQRTHGKKKEKI